MKIGTLKNTTKAFQVKVSFKLHPSDAQSHLFAVINLECVEIVLHQRCLALQRQLVGRSSLDLTHGTRLTPNVSMTVESQGHLFRVPWAQCAIQGQDVKHLQYTDTYISGNFSSFAGRNFHFWWKLCRALLQNLKRTVIFTISLFFLSNRS